MPLSNSFNKGAAYILDEKKARKDEKYFGKHALQNLAIMKLFVMCETQIFWPHSKHKCQ